MERRNKKTKERGNGQGTIYFSEALNCYVAQYVEVTGKRKTLKQRKNEKVGDFKRRFNDILSSINQGTYIASSDITFISLLCDIVDQKYKDGLVSTCTHNRDLQTIAQIKKVCSNFCNKPIQKINSVDIDNSKEAMRNYSNSVIDKIWILLNRTFKVAISRRIIIWNPIDNITVSKPISKKETKTIDALTIEEEQHLRNIFSTNEENHKYKDIILFQLNTGMRIGEVLCLTLDDIDLDNNVIHITKTFTRDESEHLIVGKHTKTFSRKTNIDKGKRDFPITLQIKNILDNILSSKLKNINNMLFWDYTNNSLIYPYEINSYLSRINAKYNICKQHLSSHVLRHTFITRCRENGVDLSVIQKIVGHTQGSSITNEIYTSISQNFINQELLKKK
jgi:integrase